MSTCSACGQSWPYGGVKYERWPDEENTSMSDTPDLISSADLRDCWIDRQLATLANTRHRERMADLERQRNEARELAGEMREAIKEARQAFVIATDQLVRVQGELRQAREENARLREALENCREDSVELLGERDWWKEEPRCGYQERYAQTAKNIQIADALLTP